MGEAKRRLLQLAAQQNQQGSIGPITWTFGPECCEVEGILANNPCLRREATWLFLGHLGNGVVASLPHRDVAVEDVRRNISRLFPSITLVIDTPSRIQQASDEAIGHMPLKFDFYSVRFPIGDDNRRFIVLQTTDETGRYIPIAHLLHTLGYHVLGIAGGLKGGGNTKLDGIPAAISAMAMLLTMPKYKHFQSNPNALNVHERIEVAGYFVGYSLAHYLGFDPRCMSHLLLEEEHRQPRFKGLIEAFVGDLCWIVGHGKALANYVEHHSAVSREKWQSSDSESFRVGVANKMASALLSYQAKRQPNGEPDGGLSWLPPNKSEENEWRPNEEIRDTLLELAGAVYDSIFTNAEEIVRLGEEHPTVLIPIYSSTSEPFSLGEMFIVGETSQPEQDFISQQLANPKCFFVVRVSEAWALKNTPSGLAATAAIHRGEMDISEAPDRIEAIRFRFSGVHLQAEAVCIIHRPWNTLEKGKLNA